jgi:signal transduction histidine kinase/ActR/RegA family two-component response regulator
MSDSVPASLRDVLAPLLVAQPLDEAMRAVLRAALETTGRQSGALWARRDNVCLCLRASRAEMEASDEPPQVVPEEPDDALLENLEKAATFATTSRLALELCHDGQRVGILEIAGDANCLPLLRELEPFAAAALWNGANWSEILTTQREWEFVFDGMPDGVCIEREASGREGGTIIHANRAFVSLLGLEIGEILGQRREDIYARLPRYQLLQPPRRVAASGVAPFKGLRGVESVPVRQGEFRFGAPERIVSETTFSLKFPERRRHARDASTRYDGSARHQERANDLRDSLAPEGENGGRRTVCILRDITESYHLQEQVTQAEKLAALGELISGVAHELNNPLTTVVGYAQLWRDDPNLSESLRRQMTTVHTEAERASRIVGNLLAFARREEPRKSRLAINDVLRATVVARAGKFNAQGTKVIADYAPDLPFVWGDAHQLQQVFLNVLNNAHQAIHDWRGSGEIHLRTQLSRAGGVRIVIADDGPGIAPENLKKIFDPFFTTKTAGEGTGLGMSISLGIVSNHDGRLWAESTLGQGACFFIELPGMDEEAPAIVEEPPVAPRSILVVDDEEPVVMLITEVLHLDGHEVTAAYNGAEALALLQERQFDFIISDVRMPAVGGPTFFEILQTIRPDLLPRVVFVTGDTVSASTQEFLKKANRPMLPKPFDPEKLRTLVNENLQRIADEEKAQNS